MVPPRVRCRARLPVTGAGVTLKILAQSGAADRWAAAGELRRRILAAFAKEGIAIAG